MQACAPRVTIVSGLYLSAGAGVHWIAMDSTMAPPTVRSSFNPLEAWSLIIHCARKRGNAIY